jgi:hypothetical protein
MTVQSLGPIGLNMTESSTLAILGWEILKLCLYVSIANL